MTYPRALGPIAFWGTLVRRILTVDYTFKGVILVGVFITISCRPTQLKINIKCFTAENMLLCCLSALELKSPKAETIVSKSEKLKKGFIFLIVEPRLCEEEVWTDR